MKRQIALSMTDAKNIVRDSTLILLLSAPLGVFIILRFGIPYITPLLLDKFGFDLKPYNDLIVSFMTMIPVMLFGLLTGFLILDERDEDIIAYIAITPLGKSGYMQYKIFMSCLMSFLFFFVVVFLTGLSSISWLYAPGIAFMVSLEAPMAALFLAAYADNKIEGLAYSKVIGIPLFAPIAAYFIPSSWHFLLGIFPQFWVMKAYFAAQQQAWQYGLYIILGIGVHLFFLHRLLKRFTNQAR